MNRRRSIVVSVLLASAGLQMLRPGVGGAAAFAADADPTAGSVPPPSWVFPVNSAPPSAAAGALNGVAPLHIPGSDRTFTEAQLNDRFEAPDWHPQSHAAMPGVVAHGERPNVNACGFCHMPDGRGRPERRT
jgi:hypothetical protein